MAILVLLEILKLISVMKTILLAADLYYMIVTIIDLLSRVPTKATIKSPCELWTGRKPSLKHLHIWRCPAQARPYVPKERKLDSRTASCYFVIYSEKSCDLKFYDPSTRRIFKTRNVYFFEDIEFDVGNKVGDIVMENYLNTRTQGFQVNLDMN